VVFLGEVDRENYGQDGSKTTDISRLDMGDEKRCVRECRQVPRWQHMLGRPLPVVVPLATQKAVEASSVAVVNTSCIPKKD
jgi:hypothetical protein